MAADWIEKRFEELKKLAEERFSPLSAAEIKMLRAAIAGDRAWCGPSQKDDDPLNNPSSQDEWGKEREIRADLLRWLCVDKTAETYVDPQGIVVHGAKISSSLNLSFAEVRFPLGLRHCRFCDEIVLVSTKLPALVLSGSAVPGILADGSRFQYCVFLDDGFSAAGAVSLVGAQIDGSLDCRSGIFKNPPQANKPSSGKALNAESVSVGSDVFLRDGFHAEGAVSLQGAQIAGSLVCVGGIFKNPPQEGIKKSGIALSAQRASIKNGVFLRDGFAAEGQVSLVGAKIEGGLDCTGGTFKNPTQATVPSSGAALLAENAMVKGAVFLRFGFAAEGLVHLLGTQIDGDLECDGASFHSVVMQRATVKRILFWRNIKNPREAELDLRNASIGSLVDDKESWPGAGKLSLDGFTYGRIAEGLRDSKDRLEWLDRQASFSPQPYRQLAKVLREEGDDDGARQVLYEMENRKHQDSKRGLPARLWNLAFRGTIGYGIYPWWAVRGLLVLVVLGWSLYCYGYFAGAMSPTNREAYNELHDKNRVLPHYPHFCASVYSFENSFPLVNLGQKEFWTPDPNQKGLASILRGFRWFQILLGWVLGTFFVAGVTGIARKD